MNQQELNQAVPMILEWIDTTIEAFGEHARTVASYSFQRLPKYYSTDILNSTKVIEVDRVPIPPLAAAGLTEFAEFEDKAWAGITYFDTYFAIRNDALRESLHFHELVHVLQWRVLGPEQFLLKYATEFLEFGYRESPLEVMAYKLQARFEQSADPFDAEKLVEDAIGDLNTN